MIVPPRSSHSTGIDVIRNDVVIVRELSFAESAHPVLSRDLSVHQHAHLGIRTDFPISAGVLRIVNAADAHLARSPFPWYCLSSAAEERTMDRAEFVSGGVSLRPPDRQRWIVYLEGVRIHILKAEAPVMESFAAALPALRPPHDLEGLTLIGRGCWISMPTRDEPLF
jgi:hypothetical protein